MFIYLVIIVFNIQQALYTTHEFYFDYKINIADLLLMAQLHITS